jgi:hypothetical protein
MKDKVFLVPCTVGLVIAIAFLGVLLPNGYARRGGGGGPRGGGASRGGGFSHEGPAANGGLSSRAGSTQGGQRSSAQASHQQYAASAQASRQQHAASAQASRQEYAEHAYRYNNWDAGRGLAVATGAAIGAATANAVTAPATAPTYGSGQPCADSSVVPVGDIQYFRCGSVWYTEAYGPSGPAFVQVAAPPGY